MAPNHFGYGLLLCLTLSLPAYAQTDEGNAAFAKHDYRAAPLIWQPRAEQGDAAAQYGLGLVYSLGNDDAAPDPEQANIWFEKAIAGLSKAAKDGDVMAQYLLGGMYSQGEGGEPNAVMANFWFQKAMGSFREAAEQGTTSAQYWLGQMYLNGQGVSRDEDQAIIWLSKAAEQGDLDAQLYLGEIYTYAQYDRRDSDLAIKWLTKAAEQGDLGAQQRLGNVYAERAHPNDAAAAAYWFRKEADTKASSVVTDASSETTKPTNHPIFFQKLNLIEGVRTNRRLLASVRVHLPEGKITYYCTLRVTRLNSDHLPFSQRY